MQRLAADVVVVGAGPAGVAAACAAAEAGASVLLLDESPRPGGQIWRHLPGHAPRAAQPWLARFERSGARLRAGTTVVDAGPGFTLLAECEEQPLRVEARRLVIATGARELFLPFPGWTLPGVVGVGAAQALLKSGARFSGRRALVAGSGPLLLPVAAALAQAGAEVVALLEQAPARAVARFGLGLRPGKLVEGIRYQLQAGARYRPGRWLRAAHGTSAVEAATLSDGRRLACDVVCTGYGLVPNLELARLLGCAVVDGSVAVGPDQQTSRPGVYCAGEPTGIGGLERALVEGEIAGRSAAGAQPPAALLARRRRWQPFVRALARAFAPRPELRGLAGPETIVCRCEDVALGRLRPEWSVREAKLATRAGMGACQARVCGPALSFLFGWQADSVRAPLKPARVATLAALQSEQGPATLSPTTPSP